MDKRHWGNRLQRPALRRRSIVWCVCSIHVTWGMLLLWTPSVLGATPLAPFNGYAFPHWLIASVLLSTGALPALIFFAPLPVWLDVLLILPQQTFLFHSALSSVTAIWRGAFADGAVYPRGFIFGGEAATIWVAWWHTIALLRYVLGDEMSYTQCVVICWQRSRAGGVVCWQWCVERVVCTFHRRWR